MTWSEFFLIQAENPPPAVASSAIWNSSKHAFCLNQSFPGNFAGLAQQASPPAAMAREYASRRKRKPTLPERPLRPKVRCGKKANPHVRNANKPGHDSYEL